MRRRVTKTTVKNLIGKLSEFPEDAKVKIFVGDSSGIEGFWPATIVEISKGDESTTVWVKAHWDG